jgi:O-antigen/teichoic acid export membrane protein
MSLRALLSLITGVVGARMAGAVAALVTQVLLARMLAPHDMGIYFLSVSVSAFAGLLMSGGYSALGITYLSRYRAWGRMALVQSFIAHARRDIALISGVLIALGCLALIVVPMDEGTRTAILIGLFCGPAVAFIRLQGAIANSARRFTISFLPDFVLRPALLLVFVLAVLVVTGTVTLLQALLAFLAITYLIAGFQAWVLWPEGVFVPRSTVRAGPRGAILRRRATALIVVALVTTAYGDFVILASGLVLPPSDVAVFGVAMRLAALVGFITQACYQFTIPDFTEALVGRDADEVRPVLLRAILVAVGVTVLALLGAIVVGDYALLVFGREYVVGQVALVLLCVAQIVRASGGMNVNLLSLGGHQGRLSVACIASVAVLLVAAPVFTPLFGIAGVAVAVILSEAAWALSTAIMAQRKLSRRGDVVFAVTGR